MALKVTSYNFVNVMLSVTLAPLIIMLPLEGFIEYQSFKTEIVNE